MSAINCIGAIEAGGTKFVCGIGTEEGEIVDRVSFPTTTPEETMAHVISYFSDKKIDAMGVGSFGPIDIQPESRTYGYITSTPKLHWQNYNLIGTLKKHFPIPMEFQTDVNAAALGEVTWGAAKGLDSCVYITVGTGIGAGFVANGRFPSGFTHAEMGHMMVGKQQGDAFAGVCPFHGDCLEGLAAGPALEQRWGRKGSELPPDHAAWELEADYLARAFVNMTMILMPHRMVLGGGVSKQTQLFPLVRKRFAELLNGYVVQLRDRNDLESYIVPPAHGDNAGLVGSVALANLALRRS